MTMSYRDRLFFGGIPRVFICAFFAFFILHSAVRVSAADWPQLGCNAGKTSWTPDEPKPPYAAAWVFDVWPDDRICPSVQAVTWRDRCFFGTKRGVVYAVSLADSLPPARAEWSPAGRELWRYDTGGRAIMQSAAVADGVVVVGTMDGCVYGLDADTGALRWKTDLNARGITVAPLLYKDRIYLGTRGGAFVCLEPANGAAVWRREIGRPVLQSAAAGDGRIFFAPEDRRMRCLDADSGEPLWTANCPFLSGTLRGSFPVYCKGKVIFRHVGIGTYYPAAWYDNPLQEAIGPRPVLASAGLDRTAVAFLEAGDWDAAYSAWVRAYRQALEEVNENGDPRYVGSCMTVLDAKTGRRLPEYPATAFQTMGEPAPQPALVREDLLIHPMAYVMDFYNTLIGVFDFNTRELKQLLVTEAPVAMDETQDMSAGGDIFFTVHAWEQDPCGTFEAFNLRTRERFRIPCAYPMPAGTWKSAPPYNAVSIAGNRFLHVSADRLACWKGSE